MKRLSVIILTYNSEKDIYDCLKSVYQYNDIDDALEVIVVDNQSSEYEAMRTRLSTEYPQVCVIQNTHNGGYGQGNNVGIRLAQAPIVAIMNPDVRLTQPTFSFIIQEFNDSNVVMWGGKQMHTPSTQGWSFAYDLTKYGIVQIFMRSIMQRLDRYDSKHMWLSGAFFAIRKEVFECIGLYDEQIFMYGEECDIHLRLKEKYPKGKIIYIPSISYLHLSAERDFSSKRYKQQISACIYVCRKHSLSPKRYLTILQIGNYLCYIRSILKKRFAEQKAIKEQIKIVKEYTFTYS